MHSTSNLATTRHVPDVVVAAGLSNTELRRVQRLVKAGSYERLHKGVYAVKGASKEDQASTVRKGWQRIAGAIVPGGVVSHISAITSGIQADGTVTLTHPTNFGKTVRLPGLQLVLLRGPGPLAGDLPLGNTGLHWAGRTRQFLENLGRASKNKVGREVVEQRLVVLLGSSGEKALNDVRDQAATLAISLGMQDNESTLRTLIGALLGTHQRGQLRTLDGKMMAQGTPIDQARMERFEVLAAYLRTTPLPEIPNQVKIGRARHHWAFIESYFSNFVEGTRFDVDEARAIVLENKLIEARPKDSHDILGVFKLATEFPFRDSPPALGTDFLNGLETWHAEMLRMRPEANPGKTKIVSNYAGTTKFVEPAMVRGTLEAGSALARSVPEGIARAIFYAFLVSEVHPFEDGNGRLSRLVMNSELSRLGMSRIIIPTLFHPQYVDCARTLTTQGEPDGFVSSLAKMAKWSSRFNYDDLDALIASLKTSNAMEEFPTRYKLLNADGSSLATD